MRRGAFLTAFEFAVALPYNATVLARAVPHLAAYLKETACSTPIVTRSPPRAASGVLCILPRSCMSTSSYPRTNEQGVHV